MTALKLFSKEQPQHPASENLAELIVAGAIEIGPDLARRILDEANYERQRKVRADAKARAVQLIRGDDFVNGHQIWFALVDGRLILIDGQHRMSAVYETGVSRVFQAMVIDCATMDEVHHHYCRFDRFGRRRSDAEVVGALDLADQLDVSRQVAMAAWKAAAYIADGFPVKNNTAISALKSDEDRADYIFGFRPLVRQYADALGFADAQLKRGMLTPSVVAVALLTLRDQQAVAKEFWEGVAMDDGLRRDDPRHTLVRTLRERRMNGSHSEGARMAALAWNAYFGGRRLTFIRVVSAEVRLNGVRGIK